MHRKQIIHRDIKPENFLIGSLVENGKPTLQGAEQIYIIDFGNAINIQKAGRGVWGTSAYMSVNSHKGRRQSAKDDLMSFSYIIIEMLIGEHPWFNFDEKCTLKMKASLNGDNVKKHALQKGVFIPGILIVINYRKHS
jgi:serine/threonine protein kinase